MPIVNYRCGSCGKEFAKLFFSDDNRPKECPVCKAADLTDLGLAFPEYDESAERFMSVSCEGCGDELCGLSGSS